MRCLVMWHLRSVPLWTGTEGPTAERRSAGDERNPQERYEEIVNGLTPFLRSCGYNPKKDVVFLPMSGLLGTNIKDPVSSDIAPW